MAGHHDDEAGGPRWTLSRVTLNFMVEPRYTVKPLDQSTWAAFAALVERNNGIFGGCWCMGFHPAQAWTDVQQERYAQKRAAKEQRVREGNAHAALVFEGETCVGLVPGEPGLLVGRQSAVVKEAGGYRARRLRDREIGKHRWVVTKVVEPSS